MYHVILINLAADARAVAASAHVELRDVSPGALEVLLRNFGGIDPIENAVAEAEIRVQIRHESYLLTSENKKLILYDAHRRELPGQILTVEEAMQELDGTASSARAQAMLQARAEAGAVEVPSAGPVPPAMAPPPRASKPRVLALSFTAVLLLAAILWLGGASAADATIPDEFVPVAAAEIDGLQASLAGVYLTGNEPGQHGIVVTGPGEMKLFELAAVEAPRTVYAGYRPGRIGGKLCLATDQPGGVIEVATDGNLVYGGETYLRIP